MATTLEDPSLESRQLPPLEPEPWEPIHPRYRNVLRLRLLVVGLAVTLGPWIPVIFSSTVTPFSWLPSTAGALVVLFLATVWVPRKVRRTQYLLRDRDVHLRTGCWWFRTVSVAINRIQHVEITQGPLERLNGLSELVIYTAGGFKSDVKVPGLETDLAQRLKAHLTRRATEEAGPTADETWEEDRHVDAERE
ncbi:PH domain-containing protein [Marinimicrobium locisalis]|uniref:PH domain-containing protein n=1 Tax=Marinimicrobium locisalis TaxID=546022 RepID=UPI0032216520